MSKKILFVVILVLSMGSTPYNSKASGSDPFDPNFLKPDTIESIVDIILEKSREQMYSVVELYAKYNEAVMRYMREQIAIFKDAFDEYNANHPDNPLPEGAAKEAGTARHGYIPTKDFDEIQNEGEGQGSVPVEGGN